MQVEMVSQFLESTGERTADNKEILREVRVLQVLRPAAAVQQVQERKETWALFGKAKQFREVNGNNLRGITETSKEDVVIEAPLFETEWQNILAKKQQSPPS
ncbi:hypothetical protein BASA81_002958 [Batrachochytrium salamandrivorans]|nr:hypothetical protein BASA81_002958 [Batrachochytrium salamandrivorans]